MSDKPNSVLTRTIQVAGVTLTAHILDNGTRVIDQAGFDAFVQRMATGGVSTDDLHRASMFAHGLDDE